MRGTIIFWVLCALCNLVQAEERILGFDSNIQIEASGAIVVTETIRVVAEGDQIQRGIYRDFPTLYRGSFGLKKEVTFDVLEVLRNNYPEPWYLQKQGNGVRVYIGNANVMLDPSVYIYTIKYRTVGQIGFFKEFDELYWNVTGNGWVFPIEKASACVNLPPGASPRSVEAYTGHAGTQGKEYASTRRNGCDVFLEATTRLLPGEGFTIAVTWPKGYLVAPSQSEIIIASLKANRGLVYGLCGLIIVLGYFFVSWLAVGRDPSRGIIVPLYAPPESFTPQDVRYLATLGTCDNKSFAAALLHLAVQGVLKIKQSKGDNYTLIKNGSIISLPKEEQKLCETMFVDGSSLSLGTADYKTIQSSRVELKNGVSAKIRPYFRRNINFWIVGLLITLIPLVLSLSEVNEAGTAISMFIWQSFWSIGCAILSIVVATEWKGWKKMKGIKKWKVLPITLFAVPFFVVWIFGLWVLVKATSLWVCGIYVAGIVLTIRFYHLLKAPTSEGRRMMDQIEGFKNYLTVAEQDRLNLENPPERTPQLFEKFLPYALALGVEQQWSEQFTDVLEQSSYDPEWYQNNKSAVSFRASSFAMNLGSLSQAIASSSKPPGSRSGSSGRGSSGGGGGGGGGGGW